MMHLTEGSVLMQPVLYTARSMTETEVNYSPEKDMLTILFGVERFQ